MEFTIEYDRRDEVGTVAVLADLNLKDVEAAANRLRSWAAMRNARVTGDPFLTLASPLVARVHLPVETRLAPHPETGLEVDRVPAGVIARVLSVRFGELRAVGRGLVETLQAVDRLGMPEFHAGEGGFFTGTVVMAVAALPAAGPTIMRFPGATGEVAPDPEARPVRVVTLARQHGTGGEVIAESVARQLGYLHVDYEIFRRAAEQADVSPETIVDAARHRGRLTRFLEALARGGPASAETWMSPLPLRASPMFTSLEYRSFVEQAIRDLAHQGQVVIVGHGAQLVLRTRPDVLRVLVTGSVERRAERALAGGVTRAEAVRMIKEADEERVAYFKEFYDAGWLDPSTYDLIINTDRTSLEDAAGLILEAVRRRESSASSAESPGLPPALARA